MTHRNLKPLRSKSVAAISPAQTVIVGKKPHEALFAEFSELSTKIISDKVPENYATVNQLAKIWGLERNSAARRVRMLIAAGKMREAGVYKIKAGSRSVYPIMHYARVR